MSDAGNIPSNLKYTTEHEWVLDNGDGTAAYGITDYAQSALGDIVFVELPEVGSSHGKGDSFGSVESVKSVSDIYMPVAGEVVEVNESLEDAPETVNEDPYEAGWMVRFSIGDANELNGLMNAAAYGAYIESEENG